MSAHHGPKRSIGRDAAIALRHTEWWKGKSDREVVEFQMTTVELCMPFDQMHRALEAVLGRPVFTHEFGLNYAGLLAEVQGTQPTPTFDDILALIPADKRIFVVVAGDAA